MSVSARARAAAARRRRCGRGSARAPCPLLLVSGSGTLRASAASSGRAFEAREARTRGRRARVRSAVATAAPSEPSEKARAGNALVRRCKAWTSQAEPRKRAVRCACRGGVARRRCVCRAASKTRGTLHYPARTHALNRGDKPTELACCGGGETRNGAKMLSKMLSRDSPITSPPRSSHLATRRCAVSSGRVLAAVSRR